MVFCSFDGRKKKNVSRVRQERARLAHKVKKETKSAVRELKQDNAFLARTQQKHEMQLYVHFSLSKVCIA